jgi:hypothetical protein
MEIGFGIIKSLKVVVTIDGTLSTVTFRIVPEILKNDGYCAHWALLKLSLCFVPILLQCRTLKATITMKDFISSRSISMHHATSSFRFVAFFLVKKIRITSHWVHRP